MTTRAPEPRAAPETVVLASFAYRTFSVPLEFRGLGPGFELCIVCPLCGKRCRLNPEKHHPLVDHATQTVVSINPILECPSCDWRVIVVRGVAHDIAGPRRFVAPAALSKCRVCGREFNAGAVKSKTGACSRTGCRNGGPGKSPKPANWR